VDTFKTLRTTYPTWTALRAHLTSVAGGHLTVAYQNEQYALIHYTKGKSNLTLPHVRLFRSVVWDVVTHLPVSVTPPKSEDGESIPSDGGDYAVMPFHDGTMVGQFYCKYTNETMIHTRTYFGGGNTFYGKKTFGEMVAEARESPATVRDFPPSRLFPGTSRTFVLQHPANRVVTPVSEPRLVPVHVSVLAEDGGVLFRPVCWKAERSTTLATTSAVDLLRRSRGGPLQQGVVMLSLTAPYRRFKVRTPEYNAVRRLRGNNASLDYTWLTLWQTGQLPEYLKAYPEERAAAHALVNAWKTATGEVFRYYEDVFKRHSLTMGQAPRKYKPLLFQLHDIYKQTRTPIAWSTCKEFMNRRDIPQILYVLRQDARPTMAARPTLSAAAAANNIVVLATAAPVTSAESEEEEEYADMPALISLDEAEAREEARARDAEGRAPDGRLCGPPSLTSAPARAMTNSVAID